MDAPTESSHSEIIEIACSSCGKPEQFTGILSDFVEFDGEVYCQNCYEDLMDALSYQKQISDEAHWLDNCQGQP